MCPGQKYCFIDACVDCTACPPTTTVIVCNCPCGCGACCGPTEVRCIACVPYGTPCPAGYSDTDSLTC